MAIFTEAKRRKNAPSRRSERLSAGTLQGDSLDLFEALREYRLEQAKEQGVPPSVVASDRTLRDLAMPKPRNSDELKLAHGIGPAKAERYGSRGLLDVIRRFLRWIKKSR